MLRSLFPFKKAGGNFSNVNLTASEAMRLGENKVDEYRRFFALPMTVGIRAELERLEDACKSSKRTYPCSSNTCLERAVLELLQKGSTEVVIPEGLLELLLQRLGAGCAEFNGTELVFFLRDSLLALCALAGSNFSGYSATLLKLALDEHLLVVLRIICSWFADGSVAWAGATIKRAFTEADVILTEGKEADSVVERTTSCSLNDTVQTSILSYDVVMYLLCLAVRLLVAFHVGLPATHLSTLANEGPIWHRQDGATTTLFVMFGRQLNTTEKTLEDTHDGKSALVKRASVVKECVRLFLTCSRAAYDLVCHSENEEEEQKESEEKECDQIVAELLSYLALLIHSLCGAADETMLNDLVTGIGVQFLTFFMVKKRKTLDLMLRQMSCGILLLAKLLKEFPLLTIEAMRAASFFDTLVHLLQVVGDQYQSTYRDEDCVRSREECLRGLKEITDLELFRTRKISQDILHFSRVRFDRLAENDGAEEFLQSYLSLLEAQRHAKLLVKVKSDPAILRHLTEIELTVMRTFLEAPKILTSSSCMCDTLMKFVLYSLPFYDGVSVHEKAFDGSSLISLLNAGLCIALFHNKAFSAFRTDPRLHYAATYLLHYMLTRQLGSLEENVEGEVGVILDFFHNVDADGTLRENGIVDELSLMCAVLISAIYGPNTTLILDIIMRQNCVALFAETAKKVSMHSNSRRRVSSGCGGRTAVGQWVIYLLTLLLRQPEIRQSVLLNQTDVVFSLIVDKKINKEAEQMLISLLSYKCTDEKKYLECMASVVRNIWGVVVRCLDLGTEGAVVDVVISPGDATHLLLSLFYCIRASILVLSRDSYHWGPVRQLQNALCGATVSTPGPFTCLLHRAVLPWHGVKVSHGLSCLLYTIASLVRGNPALRSRLFRTIDAERLVECFKNVWFTAHSGSWMQFVRSVLALVYEEDDGSPELYHNYTPVTTNSSSNSNNNSIDAAVGVLGGGGKLSGRKKATSAANSLLEKDENTAIQNPEFLVPLLTMFTNLEEFTKKHRDALEYLLLRILRSLRASRVSLWMVANTGFFASLTALIPVVTGTALLETVRFLIIEIASHHIGVRETKHFLLSIAHTESEELRRRFVPIVIEVLNVASSSLLNICAEQQSYIAFRERSGPTGVRAVLYNFPQDGYSVSMWLRMERCGKRHLPQCLFSLQGIKKRTVLELLVTVSGVSIIFQDLHKRLISVDLKCSIQPAIWLHLAVVHRRATFPFSGSEFLLFLNGEEVETVSVVQYPELFDAYFYIGTRGENVEERHSKGCFTGQMASVYFFNRPFSSSKEIMDLFLSTSGVLTLKQYAPHVAVHIDPRFVECGQLRNLAALMRVGKPGELSLITYEGTIACNKNSILDSICLLGALQTVVVPLFLLLLNPQLPFQCRVPVTKRKEASEATREAMDRLLQLVESLLLSDIVRADVVEIGLFPIISQVLQQFINYDCVKISQRLWNICMRLLSDSTIFDTVYTTLFLSGDLLHACSEKTQLSLIKTQYIMSDKNAEFHQRLRNLDVRAFVVCEIIHVYNTFSPHHTAMRSELFTLLEKVIVDPITMNDADAIVGLIVATLDQKESPILVEVLERTRIIVARRNSQLAVYIGKKNFALVLIPILRDACIAVRNEALLFLSLIVSRSRWTQELLNPTLVTAHGAVHVWCGVSLSWLKDKLQTAQVDVTLYETLRAALTGRFDVLLRESIELQGNDKITFVPALTPLLQLMSRCQDGFMRNKAMIELATLVKQDTFAWKSILLVPGWYASIVDLYLYEEELEDDKKAPEKSLFLTSTVTVLVRTIFQALLHETYGASEMELLVACLIRQRAHRLLNALLLGVVEEYNIFFASRHQMIGSAHLGLGSQHAASNFAAFIFTLENVLFYSTITCQLSVAAQGVEQQRRRSYTEENELVLCATGRGKQEEEEEKSDEASELQLFYGDEAMQYRIAPDGVWLHMSLAIQTMYLITRHAAVLNFAGACGGGGVGGVVGVGGGGGGDGNGGGFGSSGNINSAMGLDFYSRERRGRKGGFFRLFVRLFRVACNFTLRDQYQIDSILLLSERWVRLIPNEQGTFVFALLRRQMAEQKEHSPFSGSMIMILSLHELLLRRLRFSVYGPSAQFADANCEILACIKSICLVYRKPLSQLQIFSTESLSDEGSMPQIQMDTLSWLCCTSHKNSIAEFVEIASRPDYDSFIRHCTLIMERDQLTEKGMVWQIEQEHNKIMSRLHQIVTNLNVARKTVLDGLEQQLQAAGADRTEIKMAAERYGPHGARTLAMEMFNSVWRRFIERCKGTIWDFDPAGQRSTKYVRLFEAEQQRLIRRKFIFDSNGTNHANITPMGSSASADQLVKKQCFSFLCRERVVLSPSSAENEKDEEEEEEEEINEEKEHGSVASHLALIKQKQEVRFSIECEAPYMMHCWSATFMIREGDVCVFFDDENKSYNQRISDEAKLLIIKPGSIIYPAGSVVMLAPGRRFRMQRTALELCFIDGKSILLNFFTITSMRVAAKAIRSVADRQRVAYTPFCVLHENPRKESLLVRQTEQWRDCEISNFDYLLWLNFFAGRTLNDLTQYPVFPWVIADYTSEELDLEKSTTFRDFTLPVGACGGPEYRTKVKKRYEETRQIGDVPAHYFTHYSSSAVVLYYLIRVEPFTTLHIILQGGHFDHADRMFHSVASCWRGVTTNSQDVRELIPELFYMPELCTNTNQVGFGSKQGGEAMDSLELPPWAHGDPYVFVYCMREALESDYVSSMLHHWIDLVFGYKQRGREAVAALNVFNCHSYEDFDKNFSNDADRQLFIDSLDNIGQTPIQLFTRGHVERRLQHLADPVDCFISIKKINISSMCARVTCLTVLVSDRLLVVGGGGNAMLFKLFVTPVMKRAAQRHASNFVSNTFFADVSVVSMPTTSDDSGTGGGDALKVTTSATTTSTLADGSHVKAGDGTSFISTAALGRPSVDMTGIFDRRTAPLQQGVVPNTNNRAGGPCETGNVAILCLENEIFVLFGGLFDNTLMIVPLNSAFCEQRLSVHRGRVVCIAASSDSKYFVSGAEDTTFIVWACHLHNSRSKLHTHLLFTVYGHEDNPTAVDLSTQLDLVATASRDGVLMLHSLMSGRLERSLRHPEKFAIDRVLIQARCYLPNILYASAVDDIIHQVSINGVELRSVSAPGRITGWCVTPKQYILVVTAPRTKSTLSADSKGTIFFIHSFYLFVLRSVSCSLGSFAETLTCCDVHPLNSQVIVCGSSEGSLFLLRITEAV